MAARRAGRQTSRQADRQTVSNETGTSTRTLTRALCSALPSTRRHKRTRRCAADQARYARHRPRPHPQAPPAGRRRRFRLSHSALRSPVPRRAGRGARPVGSGRARAPRCPHAKRRTCLFNVPSDCLEPNCGCAGAARSRAPPRPDRATVRRGPCAVRSWIQRTAAWRPARAPPPRVGRGSRGRRSALRPPLKSAPRAPRPSAPPGAGFAKLQLTTPGSTHTAFPWLFCHARTPPPGGGKGCSVTAAVGV